jgi:hypothetical protein
VHLPVFLLLAAAPSPNQCSDVVPYVSDEERFWGPWQPLERCPERTPQHQAAAAALKALDDRIAALDAAAAVGPVTENLHALLRTPCFALAREDGRIPRPDSALSLKEWWNEGGKSWLGSYLHVAAFGNINALKVHVIVPGDPRPTLDSSRGAGSGLGPILCGLSDPSCGLDTRGWLARAEEQRRLRRWRGDLFDASLGNHPAQVSRACQEDPTDGRLPFQRTYEAWRSCLTSRARHDKRLPLASFRAPSEGWFVLRGRRGHYEFCDGVWLYDLRTGAAFVAESCAGLALQPDGHVDHAATKKRRTEHVRAGRVPLDNLREATLLALLLSHAPPLGDTESYELPDGMEMKLVHAPSIFFGGRSVGFSTAQTSLRWTWARSDISIRGHITWPYSDDALEDHAINLIEVAESGFVEGCVPGEPPSLELALQSPPGVSGIDARQADVEETHRRFAAAVTAWKRAPRCP